MELNEMNYYSLEANQAYWSVSQFKHFYKCEAQGLAEVNGEYERSETPSLLIGSYIDSYFSGDLDVFTEVHPEIFNSRTGELKSDFKKADEIIARIERDPYFMSCLEGEKQTIFTAELFGVQWKAKLDVYDGERIVDLKIVKDFDRIYEDGYGRRPWIEYWGYDIQGAMYQKIVEANTGKKLPFYLAAATKETIPDIQVIQIPQAYLDGAASLVEAFIERFDLIKSGYVEPRRCGRCDYCKRTKVLTGPVIYEREGD